MNKLLLFSVLIGLLASCTSSAPVETGPLMILGQRNFIDGDTVYHQIADFSFFNQDSAVITNADFEDKAYLVDFFFTACPTICPKVKKQMLRVYEKYENDNRLALVSHTIDTKRDTVGKLKIYAKNLGVSSDKWHFLTGEKDAIWGMSDDYFSTVIDDPDAPGGFDHSGRVILVDKNRHIRSFADGTSEEEMDRLMQDIDRLLAEY